VYDVCQDEKGFYWIATDNGLQRYDGKRWVANVSGDPESLPSRPIHQLINLDNSTLLVKMAETYGLFNTNNFRFTRLAIKTGKETGAESFAWKDSKGNVFLILKGENILWLDIQKKEFTEKLPISIPADIKPEFLFEDVQKKHYWVGGKNGLAVYDASKNQLYANGSNPLNLPLLNDPRYKLVTSLYIDTSRNHWIVFGNDKQSFACYSERENKYVTDVQNLSSYYKGTFEINRLFQSVEGEMWLYGRSALFNYEAATKEFYNNKSDILNNMGARFSTVRSIMQDREKGIWIATNEGLYQFYTVLPEVRNIIFKTEKDDNNITAVEELDNGDLWFSSRGKGIISLNFTARKRDSRYLFDNVAANSQYAVKHALDVHQHSSGKIWVACVQGTLMVADNTRSTSVTLQPSAFAGENVTTIAEDLSGRLWFGTSSGNIIMFDVYASLTGESFHRILSVKGRINKLLTDKQGTLWICTSDDGLLSFDTHKRAITHHYRQDAVKAESLSSNMVNDIVQLNDSIYAIATELFDLLNIKTKAVRSLSFQNGLLSNTILGMQKDRQDYLWIATSNGICRYNYARNKFTAYEEKDGFMNYESVGTAGTLLSDGKILLAGRNSMVTFPPELLNRTEAPPKVAITDLRVLNSFVPLDSASGKMEFDHNTNSLNFYFSAMSYLLKDKLSYYYRLNGVDKKWTRADNQLVAVYTLLPSGKYTFEVRCENEEGISSPITSFAFTINPPFWKTWWFLAIVIICVGALLFLVHRLRINRIIALAELRNRVARDLHDDVGSTLSTISILSTIAKGKLEENPVQAKEYISKISDNSQQMMDAMDDIVWSIKPMNDSMQKIIARMREFASGALEPKNVDIDFHVDEHVPHIKLNMEARRDLFLIFKEAINNVAKYSHCTNVMINVSYADKSLLMKIKDNGTGFDTETADSGNGISNMKKRAAMLNGHIRWQSDRKRGTLVLLNIPVNR
jgi:signal transduction histidine kinase/ligand-binding sensor domain-containing protein